MLNKKILFYKKKIDAYQTIRRHLLRRKAAMINPIIGTTDLTESMKRVSRRLRTKFRIAAADTFSMKNPAVALVIVIY